MRIGESSSVDTSIIVQGFLNYSGACMNGHIHHLLPIAFCFKSIYGTKVLYSLNRNNIPYVN